MGSIKYGDNLTTPVIPANDFSAGALAYNGVKYPCVFGNELKRDYFVDIYGQSTQMGVPTPTTPVEVKSLGENNINLFNVSQAENGSIANADGTNYYSTNRCRTNYMYLKAGTYALSTSSELIFGGYCHMYSAPNESSWLGATTTTTSTLIDGRNVRIATVSQDSYVRFVLLPPTGSTITNLSTTTLPSYEPQIEEGTVATSYIPYCAITIKETGKNLLNYRNFATGSGTTGTLIENGVLIEGNWGINYILNVKPNTNYTLSFNSVNLSDKFVTAQINAGSPSVIIGNTYGGMQTTFNTRTYNTIKIYLFASTSGVAGKAQFTNIMLCESNQVMPYEPYQEPIETLIDLSGHEPLRKIGDVADYIDYENGQIVRNIGKYIITGGENWHFYGRSGDYLNYNYFISLDTFNTTGLKVMSNKYLGYSHYTNFWTRNLSSGIYAGTINDSLARLIIATTISTASEFKTWLAEQYTNGTPVIVYYQLATPTTEQITLPTFTARNTSRVLAYDSIMNASEIKFI